jgi:hypothetical protein
MNDLFPSAAPHRSENLITFDLGRNPLLAGKQSTGAKDLFWTSSFLTQTRVGTVGENLDPTRGLLVDTAGAATYIPLFEDAFPKDAIPDDPWTARFRFGGSNRRPPIAATKE